MAITVGRLIPMSPTGGETGAHNSEPDGSVPSPDAAGEAKAASHTLLSRREAGTVAVFLAQVPLMVIGLQRTRRSPATTQP